MVAKVFGVKETEDVTHTLKRFQEEMVETDTPAGLSQEAQLSITRLSERLRVECKTDTVSLLSVETKTPESESSTILTSTLTKEDLNALLLVKPYQVPPVVKEFGAKETEVAMFIPKMFQEETEEEDMPVGSKLDQLLLTMADSEMLKEP